MSDRREVAGEHRERWRAGGAPHSCSMARYYNPGIGRFISEDPLEIAFDQYTYVASSPVDSTDPSGLYRIINNDVKPLPHGTKKGLDEACKPYLTAGECAAINGALTWTCFCVGWFYQLETTVTLSGTIHYYDGQLPMRPAVDPKFRYGAPKDAATRHVDEFHVGIALGSLLPMVMAYEAIPYSDPVSCNNAGLFLHLRFHHYFRDEMKRTRDEEARQRRPRVIIRTDW